MLSGSQATNGCASALKEAQQTSHIVNAPQITDGSGVRFTATAKKLAKIGSSRDMQPLYRGLACSEHGVCVITVLSSIPQSLLAVHHAKFAFRQSAADMLPAELEDFHKGACVCTIRSQPRHVQLHFTAVRISHT